MRPMKPVTILMLVLASFAAQPGAAAAASDKLHLLTNIAPPYQEIINGQLDGTSLRALSCVMDRLNQRYEVGLVPWLRAREEVRRGLAQGLFSVAPDPDRHATETLSLPLALERWVWVTVKGGASPGDPAVRTGAVLGSNQLSSLIRQGHKSSGVARNAVQLLRMLMAGRIQAALIDEAELLSAARDGEIDTGLLAVDFERYAPLSVAFAPEFLQSKPGFLERFNKEVPNCAASNMTLTREEKAVALEAARMLLAQVLDLEDLRASLTQANQTNGTKPVTQIIEEDRAFLANRDHPNHPLVQRLWDHPLTAHLRQLRIASGELVTEIMLFDQAGVAIAADPMPSDLWQADEPKYSRTVAQGPTAYFVDAISFDQSTAHFSVQVSFAIAGSAPDSVIGGVTIGLDIEKTLNKVRTD